MAQAAQSELPQPVRLTNWHVRRSGACMTVEGLNDQGDRMTIPGFVRIVPGGGYAVAFKAEDTVTNRVILA